MKCSRLLLAVLLAYIVSVAVGIEATNAAWGHLLPQHGPEQDGSGYGKMRGPMGEFQDILCLFGTWVYPACVVAALAFIHRTREATHQTRKALLFACAALCLAVLARFFYLGVFTSAWKQFL